MDGLIWVSFSHGHEKEEQRWKGKARCAAVALAGLQCLEYQQTQKGIITIFWVEPLVNV